MSPPPALPSTRPPPRERPPPRPPRHTAHGRASHSSTFQPSLSSFVTCATQFIFIFLGLVCCHLTGIPFEKWRGVRPWRVGGQPGAAGCEPRAAVRGVRTVVRADEIRYHPHNWQGPLFSTFQAELTRMSREVLRRGHVRKLPPKESTRSTVPRRVLARVAPAAATARSLRR